MFQGKICRPLFLLLISRAEREDFVLGSLEYKCSSRDLEDKGSLKWLCKLTFKQQRLSAMQPKLFIVSVSFQKVSHSPLSWN